MFDGAQPELHLTRALGAIDGDVDWNLVPVDAGLAPTVLDGLAERAPDWWLLNAATPLPAKRADRIRKPLRDRLDADRSELAADAIVRWIEPDREAGDAAGWIRGLKSIVGENPTPRFLDAVVHGVEAALGRSSPDGAERDRLLAALATVAIAAEAPLLAEAISRRANSPESVRRWVLGFAAASENVTDRAANDRARSRGRPVLLPSCTPRC